MGVLVVENGEIHSEVGTGFTQFQRKWFAEHIDEVIESESIVKIKAHRITESGSLHGPVFLEPHYSKSNGPILELALYDSADSFECSPYALKSK